MPIVRRIETIMTHGLDEQIAEDIHLIAWSAYPNHIQEAEAKEPQKSAFETLSNHLHRIKQKLLVLMDFFEGLLTVSHSAAEKNWDRLRK